MNFLVSETICGASVSSRLRNSSLFTFGTTGLGAAAFGCSVLGASGFDSTSFGALGSFFTDSATFAGLDCFNLAKRSSTDGRFGAGVLAVGLGSLGFTSTGLVS